MKAAAARFLRLGLALCGLVLLGWVLTAHAGKPSQRGTSLTTDWSHRHLIFSRPGSDEQLARVAEEPRYWQQIRRSEQALMLPTSMADADSGAIAPEIVQGYSKKLKRDWSEDLGNGASAGAGNYPAKYSFRGTTANCGDAITPDYVVYSTGLEGSSTQASVVAFDNLYAGCSKLNLRTAANFAVLASSTVTSTGNTVVTGANIGISPGTSLTGFPPGVLAAPAVEHLGDAVASQAQADANTAYTYFQGLTGAVSIASLDGQTLVPGLYKSAAASLGLSAGASVELNGNGTYIFQIGSTLDLAGTVVLSGGATAGNVIWLVGSSATLEGTAVAAGNVVALASITLDGGASLVGRAIALNGAVTMIDNAISTVDTVPSVYWAFNTGGQILTSPLISLDGSQVAFVETSSGHGILVMLKWAAGSGTLSTPVAPSLVSASSYSTCSVPCMTQISLQDGSGVQTDDTTSSVFYDYSNDIGWVGGARGWLHKITGVFNGTPIEVHNSIFPVQVNSGSTLSSPVYDSGSQHVFVGDLGGFLYSVNPTTAAVTPSARLDSGTGIVEGPVIDSTNGFVYVFSSSDGSSKCAAMVACSAVYQLITGFTTGATGTEITAGNSVASGTLPNPNPMYIGGFNSTYLNSTNATGNIYLCGNTGGIPTLYGIHFIAGVPGASSSLTTLAAATAACSPVADVFNPNTTGGVSERLFFSVQNNALPICNSTGGCILSLLSTVRQSSTSYAVGQQILANLHVQTVITAGVSGATTPTFTGPAATLTSDGTVVWIDGGDIVEALTNVWTKSHTYPVSIHFIDPNGNVEAVTTAGKSGASEPAVWNGALGGTTVDNTVTWTNIGAACCAALPAAGGTSGIIIDDVLNGTVAGTSQVYFNTLSNQVCGTSSTGGCAVQASQTGLN